MRIKEKSIQISMVVITLIMTILRFLLNEKGRVNPDSIRYMRFAHGLPEIDNTTTPIGYPAAIKWFTFLGFDEFWGSKAIGILAFLFLLFFTWRKKFYARETIVVSSLFSFLSIYSYTMSEALTLPFVLLLLYSAMLVIKDKIGKWKGIIYLSLSLIAIYNIRYTGLFIVGGTGLFGLLYWKRKFAPSFIISGSIGFVFIILYKFLFIDYFNENYIAQNLNMGLHTTPQLLVELFQGLCTTFNPFVHIANPSGGMINYGIYGIGFLTICFIIFLFIWKKLSETESFFIVIGVSAIICSYFVQYFYSVNAIDYRLMAPFSFPIWLVGFKKLFQIFSNKVYVIGFLSLITGMIFTWLSKGNYLENRKAVKEFLQAEKLDKVPLQFYLETEGDLEKIQIAELLSTVNPQIRVTFNPQDSLRKATLTRYKVLQKIKINKNKYQ